MSKKEAKRPNIVFLLNDHETYYRWAFEGPVRPKRPRLAKLASEGIYFDHAYCATPLCGPTRRSILTGLFPHEHRNYYNYSTVPYDREVYLDTLAEAGYKNFYYGKWHAGIGDAHDHHCEGLSYTDYGNPYITPEYKDFITRKNLPQAKHLIKGAFPVKDIIEQGDWVGLAEGVEDYECRDKWCGEHAYGITTTPKETHESFFLANLACEKLEELAQSDDGAPFALRVDFWGPHQPYFPTQEFLDMYPEDEFAQMPVYGNHNDDLADKPKTYLRERSDPFGKDFELIQPSVWDWNKWKEMLRYNFAHISMIDAAGGMILDKLDELGLSENTLVIWTSDHGDGIASHGGHFDKGSFMSEEVLRVPLAVRWPGVVEPGRKSDKFITALDYPVTMLEAAGTEFTKNPAPVHGRSMIPLLKDENAPWRDDLMIETFGHGYGSEEDVRVIVWEDWKFIHTLGDISELYNLKDDPYSLHNLARDEKYKAVVEEAKKRLFRWMEETRDTLTDQFREALK